VQDFESWKTVLNQPNEFIRALYSPERVDYLLGQRVVAQGSALAVVN